MLDLNNGPAPSHIIAPPVPVHDQDDAGVVGLLNDIVDALPEHPGEHH